MSKSSARIQRNIVSNKNIIEINGQRYDAQTGALIGHGSRHATTPEPGHHIDGIKHAAKYSRRPKPAAPSRPAAAHQPPVFHDVVRDAPKSGKPHAPQSSRTLMRHTVHKPTGSVKRHSKASHPLQALAKKPEHTLALKASVQKIDTHRLKRAQRASRSKAIKRFDSSRPAAFLAPLPEPIATLAPLTISTSRPAPVANDKKPQTTAELLQHALRRADSHKQPAPAKKRRLLRSRRITSVSAMSMAGVVLFAAVAFQNITTVKLQFASARTGFAVSLPDVRPAGYRLSHLRYTNGEASMRFLSNTDKRSYSITEKASKWNSQTLRENFLASQAKEFETVKVAGQTLYIYGKQNATWVNGGIWYQVVSEGALSSRQLVDLAVSL